MTEDELDKLFDVFYENAPYDYVLSVSERKPKMVKGLCSYDEKVCVVFSPQSYLGALYTVLHELAHAIIQHQTHSDVWEKKFVELLTKYDFPRDLALNQGTIYGPNVKEYANA